MLNEEPIDPEDRPVHLWLQQEVSVDDVQPAGNQMNAQRLQEVMILEYVKGLRDVDQR